MMVVATTSPGGLEALQVREVEDLSALGEGKLLVGVAAAGVNRGDTVQRQGRYSPPAGASPYPSLECSGTIVVLGANTPRAGPSVLGVRAAYRRRVCGEGCGSGRATSTDDRGRVAD
ncbi:uncharacterized protein [Aegilops tauschii subsp. strangulata]|uniref:Alcohol dehydrogenase-like N-terminal domain-containing protein n=1 Tax=Aegilops tauschii subsp. strangulata TaxID=200361 RepID=A0A453RSW5_AEGTS|nr:quinone oxidoreductase PIG3-like [Aegilops tauschii subsp. strangulata]XP_044438460.1 quinone oxidoreductase PIG3-like [Triticum aestivum]